MAITPLLPWEVVTILTSPDGVSWTTRTSGTSSGLNGVAYGNGTFVAVGYNCAILTSPDGVAWTTRISGTCSGLNGVTYGNNTFVAVGGNGAVLQSDPVTINLPQTGQTKCYDSSGIEINCAGTGQDGESQAGVEWPEPRFTVSGDCVTDNLTGLMWAKNGNLPDRKKTWQTALDYVASINNGAGLCGYSDWRLPNVNELESFTDVGSATWQVNSQGFNNVQSDYYWSSTTMTPYPYNAWVVSICQFIGKERLRCRVYTIDKVRQTFGANVE